MSNDYEPKWHCNSCGSCDVQILKEAWFDPNTDGGVWSDANFIEDIESSNSREWCCKCNDETTLICHKTIKNINKPIEVFYKLDDDGLLNYHSKSKFEIVVNMYDEKNISDEDEMKEGVRDSLWRIEVFKKEVSDG
tara:strand:+ start:503 stop:910 length:408 start_codon:yes stop_codon:yes gene_type:complete